MINEILAARLRPHRVHEKEFVRVVHDKGVPEEEKDVPNETVEKAYKVDRAEGRHYFLVKVDVILPPLHVEVKMDGNCDHLHCDYNQGGPVLGLEDEKQDQDAVEYQREELRYQGRG